MDKKTILVIGAHLDDCEIGAGGLIIKAVRNGHRVVLVNVASDYSTWGPLKGKEKKVREKVLKKAKEMGVEKRFLGYGYQKVPLDLESARKIAEIIWEVKPDITLFHNQFDTKPVDHRTVGLLTEYAMQSANKLVHAAVLGLKGGSYSNEMYAYEVMPVPQFQPDTFIDIADVIKDVVELPNYSDRLYGECYPSKTWAVKSRIKINYLGDDEIPLYTHGELKLITSGFRGRQCGVRFAEAFLAMNERPLGKRILSGIL